MMKRILLTSLFAANASLTFALPRFVLRVGESCTSCHVNPTGGGMRNLYGTQKFSREELPMWADDKTKFNTQITSNIWIGADVRGQLLAADSVIHFGSNGSPNVIQPGTAAFQAMQASVYLNAQLSEKMSLYVKSDLLTPNSFEYWGLARVLPNNGYVKAGAFQPAVGLRVDDHTSFTRYGDYTQNGYFGGFGMYPHSRDLGVEVGEYFGGENVGNFFALVSLTNGDWPNGGLGATAPGPAFTRKKNVLARIEYAKTMESGFGVFLGASGLTNGLDFSTFKTTASDRNIYGFFGGVRYKVVSILADMEWGKNLPSFPRTSSANMLELAVEAIKGLQVTLKYDTFNPDINFDAASQPLANQTLTRITIGAEFYPVNFVELIPQVRLLKSHTETSAGTTDSPLNELLIQTHVWL